MMILPLLRSTTVFFCLAFSLPLHSAESVGSSAKRPVAVPASAASAGKVDINTAEIPALEALPEIGTEFANAIVASRPFKSVDDLARVPGLGPEKLKTLRLKVVASPVKPAAAAKPDPRATGGPSKPSPVNDGKAISGKEVTERYDRTTPTKPAAGKRPVETSRATEAHPSATTARATSDQPRDANGRFINRHDAAQRINLNTATIEELELLPEIGPVKAQAIIDARPFVSPEDVKRVTGIKEATYEAIKEKIRVQ